MPRFMRLRVMFFVFLAALFFSRIGFVFALDQRQELNALIQETQKKSERSGDMSFVWWIPQEYWELSFTQNPTITPDQAEKVLAVFRPYTIIAVVDGRTSAATGITYRGEAEVRSSVKVKDRNGNTYLPLSDNEISVDTMSFLAAMKPVLANVLGPMGQNMYFFVFPAQDKGGAEMANAKQKGTFSVLLDGGREFKWDMPLTSLIPQKTCPTCNQKLNGAYKFCPWDGAKLE
jgi:hypothetical protein